MLAGGDTFFVVNSTGVIAMPPAAALIPQIPSGTSGTGAVQQVVYYDAPSPQTGYPFAAGIDAHRFAAVPGFKAGSGAKTITVIHDPMLGADIYIRAGNPGQPAPPGTRASLHRRLVDMITRESLNTGQTRFAVEFDIPHDADFPSPSDWARIGPVERIVRVLFRRALIDMDPARGDRFIRIAWMTHEGAWGISMIDNGRGDGNSTYAMMGVIRPDLDSAGLDIASDGVTEGGSCFTIAPREGGVIERLPKLSGAYSGAAPVRAAVDFAQQLVFGISLPMVYDSLGEAGVLSMQGDTAGAQRLMDEAKRQIASVVKVVDTVLNLGAVFCAVGEHLPLSRGDAVWATVIPGLVHDVEGLFLMARILAATPPENIPHALQKRGVDFSRLSTLLNTAINLNEPLKKRYGVAVAVDVRVEPEIAIPKAIRTDLFRVLFEGIRNAIKGRNGALPASRRTVGVVVSRAGDFFEFRIKDNGIGMTAEQIEAIMHGSGHRFAPSQSTGSGTGFFHTIMGTCGRRGWIAGVESEPGSGTALTLKVPARDLLAGASD